MGHGQCKTPSRLMQVVEDITVAGRRRSVCNYDSESEGLLWVVPPTSACLGSSDDEVGTQAAEDRADTAGDIW